jgi:hypothetical protein
LSKQNYHPSPHNEISKPAAASSALLFFLPLFLFAASISSWPMMSRVMLRFSNPLA